MSEKTAKDARYDTMEKAVKKAKDHFEKGYYLDMDVLAEINAVLAMPTEETQRNSLKHSYGLFEKSTMEAQS